MGGLLMKKQKFIIITALTLALAGCSAPAATTTAPDNSAEMESLKAQVEELKKENEILKTQLATVPETTTPETAEPQKGVSITVGETITTSNMEFTINKVELTYDVLPDDTSGFYTHYEADAGNVYIHLDADVKNIGKQNLACDELIKTTADYNGGYTYFGQAVPEDSSTGFTYANITNINPLETLGVHFLFKCPQEVEETTNPLFIIIEPIGTKDSYILTVR